MMYPVIAGGMAPPKFSAEIAQARTSVLRFSFTDLSAAANPAVRNGAMAKPLRKSTNPNKTKFPGMNTAVK